MVSVTGEGKALVVTLKINLVVIAERTVTGLRATNVEVAVRE